MKTIEIRKTSIVNLNTDAIVNAANEALMAGGGVCGAIFRAAGTRELQDACNIFGHCNTGSAVITPGFRLQAKYVIHTVGPIWRDGRHGEPELLQSAYRSALACAVDNGCHSVGFPLISSGIYGYPAPQAWEDALTACAAFLRELDDYPLQIIFAVLNDDALQLGQATLRRSEAVAFGAAQ